MKSLIVRQIRNLVFTLLFATNIALADSCLNKELVNKPSPEKNFRAIIYEKKCTDKAVPTTEIAIIMFNEKLENDSSIVYVSIVYPESHIINWENEQKLIIKGSESWGDRLKADGTFVFDKSQGQVYEIQIEYQ